VSRAAAQFNWLRWPLDGGLDLSGSWGAPTGEEVRMELPPGAVLLVAVPGYCQRAYRSPHRDVRKQTARAGIYALVHGRSLPIAAGLVRLSSCGSARILGGIVRDYWRVRVKVLVLLGAGRTWLTYGPTCGTTL